MMEKLQSIVAGKQTAAIAGHVNPDGDCIGSTLALYNYLTEQYPSLSVDLYLEEIPEIYLFLKHADRAKNELDTSVKYDLFFALDSANPDRIGVASELCKTAGCCVNVDHHISNPGYGDVQIVYPHSSSASEIVYELLIADGARINRPIAEALYLGMMQDTGVFKYSNTSARTMEIAGKLMATGIDFSGIVDRTFFEKSYAQVRIQGQAFLNSCISEDGRTIISVITSEDKQRFGASDSDMDGISSMLLNTKDIYAAIFLREINTGIYKASMRSKTDLVDVNRAAALFGGGGHKRAAGCTITTDLTAAIQMLTNDIRRQIEENL